MKNIVRIFNVVSIIFFTNLVLANTDSFQDEKNIALKMLDNYFKEIDRLDGDGLLPRHNRKKSWAQIKSQLKKELKLSKSKGDIGRVFVRLDSAYTNLHAHIKLNPDHDYYSDGRPVLAASFQPEIINEDGLVTKYIISNVRNEYFIHLDHKDRPQKGDALIAINHQDMSLWSDENFEFCKFPLRSQCEYDFFDNFRKGHLNWHVRKPLVYTLIRNNKKLNVQIPVFAKNENRSSGSSEKQNPCGPEPEKYPNFDLVYQGYQACVYENKKHPDVALLKIKSFKYKKGEVVNDIDHVSKEVRRFAEKYWDKNYKKIKLLIIDVIENGGGDIVTDWSSQFLDRPFQDQWVQFKKTKELEDLNWRKAAFYDDPGKHQIYEKLKNSEKWQQIKEGEFIPPMPQFCYSDNGDCLSEKFKPISDPYKGKIIILTDAYCISSCTGFVWTLKNYLKERVQFAGIPDSGDSTYSRTFIEGTIDSSKKSYKLEIFPRTSGQRAEVSKDSLFRAAISTSRSTDENGNVLSGTPMKMDYFISPKWNESPDDWIARMTNEVLSKARF